MQYPVTYSRLIARELRLDAAGQARLLAGTRLTPAGLAAADGHVGEQDQLAIIRNALAIAGRPGLGLQLGSRLPLAAHGALGQLLAASPTLGEAWAALERFHALRVPLVAMRREVRGDHVYLRLDTTAVPDEPGLFLQEVMVVTIQRGIELVTGRRLREGRLTLGYPPPAHAADYAAVLHSPYAFGGARTTWRIPRRLMEQPNPFRDDRAWSAALRQCERAMALPPGDAAGAWRARVTRFLQQHRGTLWTQVAVAARFHVSPRTLIRHLKAEGTSFQCLLDAELARQAAVLLGEEGHSVESAALELGYGDATAFRRAFRRWTGLAPMAWLAGRGTAGAPSPS